MMRRPEIEGFVSISPPAGLEDFSFLAPCPSSGIIIHGDLDEHISADAVKKLAQKLDEQKNISVNFGLIEGANHFYKDKIDDLTEALENYLNEKVTTELS